MRTTFTQPQLDRLKRQAKRIQGERSGSTHSAILDELARDYGWTNWSLLAKNVRPEILQIRWKEIASNTFEVSLEVLDTALRRSLADHANQFVLPITVGYEFHAIEGGKPSYPIIEVRYGDRRGTLAGGKWAAILSLDGVPHPSFAEHIPKTIKPTLIRLLCAATASTLDACMALHGTDSYRLLYARLQESGVHEVVEADFDSLKDAQNTDRLDGAIPIGIVHRSAYWLWRAPFGWMGAIKQ